MATTPRTRPRRLARRRRRRRRRRVARHRTRTRLAEKDATFAEALEAARAAALDERKGLKVAREEAERRLAAAAAEIRRRANADARLASERAAAERAAAEAREAHAATVKRLMDEKDGETAAKVAQAASAAAAEVEALSRELDGVRVAHEAETRALRDAHARGTRRNASRGVGGDVHRHAAHVRDGNGARSGRTRG